MTLQLDIIPATGSAYHTTNIEDGVALADEAARDDLAGRYPGLWRRVTARRQFMAEVLGIRLRPEVSRPGHPVLDGVPEDWPALLGYNRVTPRPGAEVLVRCGADPLVACGEYHGGRSAVFTSDCAPHWGPPAFLDWPGYGPLWANLVAWLARRT